MALRDMLGRITSVYDKLIALVVLGGLVASLAYLGWHVGSVRIMQEKFMGRIDRMRPAHPEAAEADVAAYEGAIQVVRQPFRLGYAEWPRGMFVPEERIWCAECRFPIPLDAEVCVFCTADQPVDIDQRKDRDLDGDLMLGEWEEKHGLNDRDPSDAKLDPDNDGFTNLEEFFAEKDPRNADDAPPITVKLCLDRVTAEPFNLLFKSTISLPGGKKKFAINTRGNHKTYFVELGEQVEGFEVFTYEAKYRAAQKFGREVRIDTSVLTLKRNEKLIPLTIGRKVVYSEFTAFLLFKVDDKTHELKIGDSFDLRGKTYELIAIDSRGEGVVIRSKQDQEELKVRKCTGDEHEAQ